MAKKRKWSKEECRIRYVQGEKIGQRALAKLAGRDPAVIGRWCSADNWVEQRQQYVSKMQAEAERKTIEKTSDRLSDEWAKINEEHLKGTELFRKMALQFGMALGNKFSNASGEDKPKIAADKDFSLAVQKYGSLYKDMVQLERIALGMEYMDSNKAIAKVIRDGYDVIEPETDS